ncbi:VOC family protein [Sulfurovum sp. CS9]|uniref:VOC family protein n=1 Tax=Sulfurovum sp. CS9 TaxID=3391146 RepID=UPI0039EA288F
MHIKFDHIALRAKDPEAVKTFLTKLGFKEGKRPNFPFEGYWLYSEEKPVIHIFGGSARFRDLTMSGESHDDRHIVDHICFASDDYEETMENISITGFRHSVNVVPNSNIRQIFIMGSENLIIEIQAVEK